MTTHSSTQHALQPIRIRLPGNAIRSGRYVRFARAYYQGFLIALVLTWLPSNLLAYAAPMLMLSWFLLRTASKRTLINLFWLAALWLLFIGAHMPFVEDYAWAAALMTGVTYSSFVPLLVIPNRYLYDRELFPLMQRWIAPLVILQAGLGIVQALYGFSRTGTFDSFNGDYVEGTIHPWLASEVSFSNPMFAANMTILILALIPAFLTRRKYWLAIGFGLVSLVLASVVHVLLFATAAVAIVGILYAPVFLRRVSSWLLVGVVAIIAIVAGTLLTGNLGLTARYFTTTIEAQTPRGQVIERVLTTMPQEYPFMLPFGLGLGQFSSRAALMVTGQYFGGREPVALPLIPVQMSEPMADYFWDDFVIARSNRYYGSTHQPAFSWLSVSVEMGLLVTLLIAFFIFFLLARIRQSVRTYRDASVAMALSMGILFMCFLGIQENYWEIPQAIFSGLLILKAMLGYFWTTRSGAESMHLESVH